MKITKYLLIIGAILFFYIEGTAQDRFALGAKLGGQINYPVYLEFYEPYPYNRFNRGGGESVGETGDGKSMLVGVFTDYRLSPGGRFNLLAELLFSQRAYSQSQYVENSKIKYRKDYLDIPMSLKFKVFRNPKNGIFLESGVVQSFILSEQTDFSSPIIASADYNSRRSRANEREVNLFAFRGGGGYRFKNVDAAVYFQRDKHYTYVNGGLRYYIKL